MRDEPDGEIIAASLLEPARFEAIFERHFDAILRYALRRIGPAGEEVAAETFVVAFAKRALFRPGASSARAWLYGIATLEIHRHLRDERTYLRLRGRMPIDLSPPEPGDPARLQAMEAAPVLVAELLKMSPGDRDAFLLLALGDLSYFEISEALGIPPGTVRSRIHRVRSQLRELFGLHMAIGNDEHA